MKAKEVLQLLRISRATLTKYVKNGLVNYSQLKAASFQDNKLSSKKFDSQMLSLFF